MWHAATASQRAGFAGAELDIGAAIALATAQGVPPIAAAELVTAYAAGMRAGQAARREAEEQQQAAPP